LSFKIKQLGGFMAKTWEQLTQEEKIEDLRRDVVRLSDLLDQFQHAVVDQLGQGLATMQALTRRVSDLEQLALQIPPNRPRH
jgi:hypothetical protein